MGYEVDLEGCTIRVDASESDGMSRVHVISYYIQIKRSMRLTNHDHMDSRERWRRISHIKDCW